MYVKATGRRSPRWTRRAAGASRPARDARRALATPGLAELGAREREERVLALLRAAARRPSGVRPSAEACLHAQLDRVVVHSHPVQLTAFLCSRDSRDRWSELLAGVGERRTLYVPYVDPGFTLAARLETEIAAFEKKGGLRPQGVLLENHGPSWRRRPSRSASSCTRRRLPRAAAADARRQPRPSSAPPNVRAVAPSAAGSPSARCAALLRGGALRRRARPLRGGGRVPRERGAARCRRGRRLHARPDRSAARIRWCSAATTSS
jgi:rhamnose utilization protein RhaD (predicted bifunctional aldolase and dehydrogenase)